MGRRKKAPLALRVIKLVLIIVACSILVLAIIERLIHYYKHVAKLY